MRKKKQTGPHLIGVEKGMDLKECDVNNLF